MIKQRTIKDTVEIIGQGLQTGREARLVLKTSPTDSGINFVRTDLPDKPSLNVQSYYIPGPFNGPGMSKRRTTLGVGAMEVQTIEHLMASLAGLSIDNIVVELDNEEMPGLDGSALGFLGLVKKAGILEQDAPRRILNIEEPIFCEGKDKLLAVFPSAEYRVSYTLSYPNKAIGTQFLSIAIDERTFEKEIAPARTFCLEEEALMLLKMGLGKGANYENTLIMGEGGPIKNTLRFSDEPVRHKILDLIGDLYLAGMPIMGHVVAIKSGHALNMEMVKKLKEKIK